MTTTVTTENSTGRRRRRGGSRTPPRSPVALAVEQYMVGVLDGSIPAGELVRLAVERQRLDLEEGPRRGLRFDETKAEEAVEFFSYLKHSKGEWAGQRFTMELWQMFIVWVLFGWMKPDGTRRFRTAYVEIPRKNGKSTMGAGIGLKLAFADGEEGAEVFCLDPKTKILRDDLSWAPLADIRIGDRLLAFDEHPPDGKGTYRKAHYSEVLSIHYTSAPAVKITCTDGTSVTCSANHRWLAKTSRCRSNLEWASAGRLRVGDALRFFCHPWERGDIPQYDAGYLAGVFDGEGYFHSPGQRGSAFRIGFSQNAGLVWDRVKSLLEQYNFTPRVKNHHTSRKSKCQYLEINGLQRVLRFLGTVRPVRLYARHAEIWESRALNRQLAHKIIASIDLLPAQLLIDIETTTKTFFANGFFSHNSAATKHDQALIVHSEATRMVRATPELAEKIQIFKNNLSRSDRNQKYEPLGADDDTLDGLNVHAAIVDELHAHKTRGVLDLMETGTSSRRQPLLFIITTAGTDQSEASVCWEQHVYGEQLVRRIIEDDSFFAFISAMDEKDDWQDERTWYKANPNLGVSKKLEYMHDQARKCKNMPAKLNTFLRLDLNKWTQQVTRWIDMDQWDANTGSAIDEAQLRGRACYGGIDLSSVSDITAWVLLFPDPIVTDRLTILPRLWCPEAKLHDETNRYREQYQAWARAGWLLTTPGNAIDYEAIEAQIAEDAATFQIQEVAIDRLFQGYQLAMRLQEQHGLTVAACGMGYMSMAGPCAEFERRLLGTHLHHGGHPVLRWMANNVAVREDPAGNKKPDKASSQGKIDGIVGILLALDRVLRQQTTTSVYESRGLLTVGGSTDGEAPEAKGGADV